MIILTALITAVSVGTFTSDNGERVPSDSDTQTEGDTQDDTVEDTTQSKTPSDAVSDGDFIEYVDYSYCELGDFYVKNYSGNAVMYNPYAEIKKYYVSSDGRPLVLILHTEGALEYRGDDGENASVISLGGALVSALNSLGVPSVHCSAIHQSYDIADSYNNAEESIAFYLKMYPSVRYIFDISAIDGDGEPATSGAFDKKTCAQILFEICGQNRDTVGDNLALAVRLRSMLNRQSMSVAREIIVADNTLNSGYAPYYMTLYVGSVNNTPDEARLAMEAFALAFAEHLIKQ